MAALSKTANRCMGSSETGRGKGSASEVLGTVVAGARATVGPGGDDATAPRRVVDSLAFASTLWAMKRSTLYTIAAVLAVAALFFFMTTARAKVQCRVCTEFRGRTNCATAVGATEQAARE